MPLQRPIMFLMFGSGLVFPGNHAISAISGADRSTLAAHQRRKLPSAARPRRLGFDAAGGLGRKRRLAVRPRLKLAGRKARHRRRRTVNRCGLAAEDGFQFLLPGRRPWADSRSRCSASVQAAGNCRHCRRRYASCGISRSSWSRYGAEHLVQFARNHHVGPVEQHRRCNSPTSSCKSPAAGHRRRARPKTA